MNPLKKRSRKYGGIHVLRCQKKPKTERENLEAEAIKNAEWENSFAYYLLWHGR